MSIHLLKKKIKLNAECISVIGETDNWYSFQLNTVAKKINKPRVIKIATKINLLKASNSSTEQNLVFYIDKNLDQHDLWEIDDENNRIRVYGSNIPVTTNKQTAKTENVLNTQTQEADSYTKETKDIAISETHAKNQFESYIKELTNYFESKITYLESQLQEFKTKLSNIKNTGGENVANENQQNSDNSLQKQMQNLQAILLRMEEKSQLGHQYLKKSIKTKKEQKTHNRNWKKNGFVPIRVFLSYPKIKLIKSEETYGETIRTYVFESKIKKIPRIIKVKTKKEIKTNIQVNFYVHNEFINLSKWKINDVNNQIIFYELDKNYRYVKVL